MKEADLKIISGSSNPQLAKEIATYIGMELTETQIRRFSDGEISVKVAENVRGTDVFLIQSTSWPANDHIMEVMLIVDALRRASARRITVVTPYYGYGRQDRKVEPRVPISAKVVATMFEAVGVCRMLCLDLHADQIQGFFEIPVDHLFAAPVLISQLKKMALENVTIVSPDSGGAERARFFAKQLNCNLAIIDKRRERANESEVMHIVGTVDGRNCVLVDDMIDTAGTIVKAAFALMENGAQNVYAAATHAVLSGPAIERLTSAPLKEIFLTNSIVIPPEKKLPNMTILSVAPLIAEAILRIHDERSVSSLFL